MTRIHFVALLFSLAVVPLCSCNVQRSPGCSSDLDCRSGRVCVNSVCSFPSGSPYVPTGRHDAGRQPDANADGSRPIPAVPRFLVYLDGERRVDQQIEVSQGEFWLAAEVMGTDLLGTYEIVTEGFPRAQHTVACLGRRGLQVRQPLVAMCTL